MDALITGLGLLESPRWRDGRLWVAGSQNLRRHTEWDGVVLAVPVSVPAAGWAGRSSGG
jgi:hypothetical protein